MVQCKIGSLVQSSILDLSEYTISKSTTAVWNGDKLIRWIRQPLV